MKRKKSQMASIKGLILTWKDKAKEKNKSQIFDHKTSHINPVYRLISKQIFDIAHQSIVNGRRLFWHIDVSVIFNYPDGTEQRSTGEFETWCNFNEIAPSCVKIHEEGLREGNLEYYSYTEFTATCLNVPQVNNSKKLKKAKK